MGQPGGRSRLPNRHQPKKSSSTSVGAGVVARGEVGLPRIIRPRPYGSPGPLPDFPA